MRGCNPNIAVPESEDILGIIATQRSYNIVRVCACDRDRAGDDYYCSSYNNFADVNGAKNFECVDVVPAAHFAETIEPPSCIQSWVKNGPAKPIIL
jgi:hypothetical protein